MSDYVTAIVLGIVEGLTEFLPVSSTGHLILAGHALGFDGERADTFEVVIQLGAILAILVRYRERLWRLTDLQARDGFAGIPGCILLAITTLPALILGALTHNFITDKLFGPTTVAIGLSAGAVAILLAERHLKVATVESETGESSATGYPRRFGLDCLTRRDALWIGLWQCLALWPGISRSAATMLAAMARGFDRRTAAEYSFFAAVPVLGAAAVFQLFQGWDSLTGKDVPVFGLGFVMAFISGWFAVGWFVGFLGRVTLTPFAWYRLALAALVLLILVVPW